jgi:hypothetical protein
VEDGTIKCNPPFLLGLALAQGNAHGLSGFFAIEEQRPKMCELLGVGKIDASGRAITCGL